MKIRNMIGAGFLFLLLLFPSVGVHAAENSIRYVFPIDYFTIEVVMEKPLIEEEMDPHRLNRHDFVPDFVFSNQLHLTMMPVKEPYDGMHENTYRIAVDGMIEGTIYTVSYKGQKAKTFKAYPLPIMKEKYRNRYGSYF